MKKLAFAFALVLALFSCNTKKEAPLKKWEEAVAMHFDPALKPFYHGVASGDPIPNAVILWTRVTPDDSLPSIPVNWEIAEDENFSTITRRDTIATTPAKDYTVKVDVTGLNPDKVYYYRFSALGNTSITGRTKTAPVAAKDSLKFAVVSCSNWEWGYFNPYDKIADRAILDGVLHLGDYIYEYAIARYGDTTIGRINIPPHEIVTLKDYRTRHSLYRLDKGLRRVHQQQPFIAIWDDHEVANNAHQTGAQNHQPDKEGDYEERKAAARQAYYEWLPIREGDELYRYFSFGPLADIFMLDERLAGRSPEIKDMNDPSYNNADRSMLGAKQLEWFQDNLQNSEATWKVVGNQVRFSDVNLETVNPKTPRNLDSWDGFPFERKKIADAIMQSKIENIIIISGDSHAAWAIEAVIDVKKKYKPFAIEFGTTSVSSGNGDEGKSADTVKLAEQALMKNNPHVKYLNNRDHGYLLLTLFPQKTRAEWYYVTTVREPVSEEFLEQKFEVMRGTVKLK